MPTQNDLNYLEETAKYKREMPRLEELVNREKQINQFNELLDRIHRKKVITSSVFEWYGGPGMGKSALVELLKHECYKKSITYCWINFKVELNAIEFRNDPTLLIEKIVDEWQLRDCKNLKDAINSFRELINKKKSFVSEYNLYIQNKKREISNPVWVEPLEDVKIKFVEIIERFTTSFSKEITPLVIFFDETEILSAELVYWIEDYIINPLGRTKHVVIVWTARQPWRWRKPEVRYRLRSEKLDVFGDEEVKDQLAIRDFKPDLVEQLFQNVHFVTGGHPFAGNVVINEINTWGDVSKDIFLNQEAHLLEVIFAEFVLGYAFRGLSPEAKAAYELLALVRLFDITMLRKVLTTSKGILFDKWNFEQFSDLLNELKRTQLLDWDRGYVLEKSLRHLISEYYFTNDKELYKRINLAAREVYQDWLGRPVDNRGLFIIEDIYHNSCLLRVGENIDIKAVMRVHLEDFEDRIDDLIALRNSLDRLAGNLKRDQEIKKLVGEEVLLELVRQIKKYKPS